MNNPLSHTHNTRAILLMCAGVLLLVVNDAVAKVLVNGLNPFQILFARSLLALPLIAVLALWRNGTAGLHSRRPLVHAGRAALAVAATYCFIRSLSTLPLAQATALILTAPIFVAALSMPLLGQQVNRLRLTCVGSGFIGAIIVVRPGIDTVQGASLLALSAALLTAVMMLSARWIDEKDGFWTVTFHLTLFSALFCAFTLANDWSGLDMTAASLLLVMAVAGTLGIALIRQAFRLGEAADVAPFDYTALVWASIVGWLVWDSVPDWPVYLGALIIVGGGVSLIVLEARK